MNEIELITSESGDWAVLRLNGDIYADGHSISDDTWLDLIEEVGNNVTTGKKEVSDEDMEWGRY